MHEAFLMSIKATHSEKFDIWLTPEAKSLIEQAAESRKTSISEFIVDSAIGAARDVLKDRNVTLLDADQWSAFLAALDVPPRRHPRLERLLQEPSVFD